MLLKASWLTGCSWSLMAQDVLSRYLLAMFTRDGIYC